MSLFPNNFIRRVGATLAVVAVLALAISRIGGGIQFPFGAQPTSATQVWIPVEPQIDIAWVPGHEEGPYVSARAAILFENTTGTVLYAKNAHERRPPASTTKILTAIMALEMSRLDEIVTVSRRAASTPGSTARLYTGQKIRMDDLLHGFLLRSGNDAAVAIAEHLAGSESAFVSWMNQRAAALVQRTAGSKIPTGSTSRAISRLPTTWRSFRASPSFTPRSRRSCGSEHTILKGRHGTTPTSSSGGLKVLRASRRARPQAQATAWSQRPRKTACN